MGWQDFYRRRDALAAVLERAGRDPDGALRSAEADLFGGRDGLLLALHHKWLMALTGRIGVARTEHADPVDAVAAAWRAAAAAHPDLRRLLDGNAAEPALAPALAGEQRLLAVSADLAAPGESAEETAAAGAALLALLRAAPRHPARRTGLLRRLLASA